MAVCVRIQLGLYIADSNDVTMHTTILCKVFRYAHAAGRLIHKFKNTHMYTYILRVPNTHPKYDMYDIRSRICMRIYNVYVRYRTICVQTYRLKYIQSARKCLLIA